MDHQNVISILADSFSDNLSSNYTIKQDFKKDFRLRNLITYAVKITALKGEIYINESETSVALITYSSVKTPFFIQSLLDLKLMLNSIGIFRIGKILEREKYIKSHHPKTNYIYLWFIGTRPSEQGKGEGSRLLKKIIEKAREARLPVYLETSKSDNLLFYKNHGFEVYHQQQIGDSDFMTYFIRKLN